MFVVVPNFVFRIDMKKENQAHNEYVSNKIQFYVDYAISRAISEACHYVNLLLRFLKKKCFHKCFHKLLENIYRLINSKRRVTRFMLTNMEYVVCFIISYVVQSCRMTRS